MAKTENKTKATDVCVNAFIEKVADGRQREDAYWLVETMARLSGHPATMWGPSIIGFGHYHYRYDSGREGDMARIGFSPRKGQTVLYLLDGFPHHEELLAQLSKHKTGKSCLYVKHLNDNDRAVVTQLLERSLKWMAEKYPDCA